MKVKKIKSATPACVVNRIVGKIGEISILIRTTEMFINYRTYCACCIHSLGADSKVPNLAGITVEKIFGPTPALGSSSVVVAVSTGV